MTQQLAAKAAAGWAQNDVVLPVLTSRQQTALDGLRRAFVDAQPVAILSDHEKSSASFLIGRFLASVDCGIAAVRISAPCSNDLELMREIIRGIGFDADGLSLGDLENVFTMYLSFQKTHDNRTVLCLEEAQNCGPWLLGRIRRLVEVETEKELGLMVLVTGEQNLVDKLNELPPANDSCNADQPLQHGPLTLAASRVYIRSQIEASGLSDIAQVFEYDAITLIHEISEGVVDVVGGLVSKSIKLGSEEGISPITTDIVQAAHDALAAPLEADDATTVVKVLEASSAALVKRLTLRMNDKIIRELLLDKGHILIGRDSSCDIRIASPSVSRHHALVVNASSGIALVDMASTNGTYVDGRQINHHELPGAGVITIGDCRIEYSCTDDRQDWSFEIKRPDNIEAFSADQETQNVRCEIKGNINSKGEKIYHVLGTASYDVTRIDTSKGERWFQSEEDALAAGWRTARR